MKKQLVLLLAISSLLMTACEEEPSLNNTIPGGSSSGNRNPGSSQPLIDSFHPESAVPGSTVVILGQNFGPAVSDNYVTFGTTPADIKEVHSGTLIVTVPMNLSQGDYVINLSTRGANASSPYPIKIRNASR